METDKSPTRLIKAERDTHHNFWMNADKNTVQKYLKENIDDIDEYNRKKKEIMEQCFSKAENRFEKPNGVSVKLLIIVMLSMTVIGLIAAYFNL